MQVSCMRVPCVISTRGLQCPRNKHMCLCYHGDPIQHEGCIGDADNKCADSLWCTVHAHCVQSVRHSYHSKCAAAQAAPCTPAARPCHAMRACIQAQLGRTAGAPQSSLDSGTCSQEAQGGVHSHQRMHSACTAQCSQSDCFSSECATSECAQLTSWFGPDIASRAIE